MQPSDEALVSACRRGDEAAWEALIRRYQRLVYTVPRRAGLDEHLCADVFQSVFIKLVEKLDQLEQPSRVSAWLVTAARRETWRVSRQARLHGVILDEDDDRLDIPDDHPQPEDLMLRLEERHLVRLAVDSLDERCRTLLILLFYQPDPPSYAEIGAMMGTSEGSVGPTRARCLQKLLRLLTKTGVITGTTLALAGPAAQFHGLMLIIWG
jgi:RNA polymerase sigma factor (sigma-70 family)